LAIEVLTTLGERDAAVRDAERRAGAELRPMTDEEGLSVREVVDPALYFNWRSTRAVLGRWQNAAAVEYGRSPDVSHPAEVTVQAVRSRTRGRRFRSILTSSAHATVAGGTPLTAAELRLLPYLQTHLTVREIGERMFVSRNTVSSEVGSVYRKLGVSSRSDAVRQATTVGLRR
jgi:DNA-binding CsgD family transcriptional regulator